MEKYQIIRRLGEGSFGNVDKAENIETQEIVAIKKLKKKYGTWEECLQLSEVKALRKIVHPNIIKLKEMVRVMNDAYLIFEFYEKDILKLINQRKEKGKQIQDHEVKYITKQITQALCCVHKHGFFHRDLKPQNILISEDLQVKIIDFGIAKEIRSKPPFTQYISTRWYRAPELLFKFSSYSAPVDIFAVGCLVAEMYLAKPLFQGNSEMDQISRICSVIGSPTQTSWPEGFKHAQKKGINFPQYSQIQLHTILPKCPKDAIDFISECLKWDPSKRMTALQLCEHPFLNCQGNLSELKPQTQTPAKKPKQPSQNKKPKVMDLDRDDLFEKLLNNFEATKITSTKDLHEQDDQW